MTLATENSTLEPITLAPEDFEIQGVLVGQMRAYLCSVCYQAEVSVDVRLPHMNDPIFHRAGETETRALVPFAGPVPVDTFGCKVLVEWDPQAAVTPLGQLPLFTEFLQVGGLFDPWVESCPLFWRSPSGRQRRGPRMTPTH